MNLPLLCTFFPVVRKDTVLHCDGMFQVWVPEDAFAPLRLGHSTSMTVWSWEHPDTYVNRYDCGTGEYLDLRHIESALKFRSATDTQGDHLMGAVVADVERRMQGELYRLVEEVWPRALNACGIDPGRATSVGSKGYTLWFPVRPRRSGLRAPGRPAERRLARERGVVLPRPFVPSGAWYRRVDLEVDEPEFIGQVRREMAGRTA